MTHVALAIASIDNFSLAVGKSGARRASVCTRVHLEIARDVRGNSHKFIVYARDHGDIGLIPPDRYDTASDAYVGACAINDREASIMKTGFEHCPGTAANEGEQWVAVSAGERRERPVH